MPLLQPDPNPLAQQLQVWQRKQIMRIQVQLTTPLLILDYQWFGILQFSRCSSSPAHWVPTMKLYLVKHDEHCKDDNLQCSFSITSKLRWS
jgi:hypothetical protein